MSQKKKPFSPAKTDQFFGKSDFKKWDDYKNMIQTQLEYAWLCCIFYDPQSCRRYGLMGLDPSMFEDERLFDIGLAMLRDEEFSGSETLTLSLFMLLAEIPVVARMDRMQNENAYLIGGYRLYSEELERRADESWEEL